MSHSVLMSVDQVEALTQGKSALRWQPGSLLSREEEGETEHTHMEDRVSLKSYCAIVDESNYSLPWDGMWTLNVSNNLGQSSKSKDPKRMLITGRVPNLRTDALSEKIAILVLNG